jgi:hypothetical protein
MTVATEPVVYRARANLFQNEAEWRLERDALIRSGGEPADVNIIARGIRLVIKILLPLIVPPLEKGGYSRFPYAEVKHMRLSFEPTRADRERFRCEFQMADGSKARLFSTHFAGVSSFENRAASYTPFVRELVARVAAANPSCQFRSGKWFLHYWLEHTFLLAMFGLLILVLFAFGGAGLSELVLIKLGIIVFFIPVLIGYTWRNWPRSFVPPDIPAGTLPDV